MLKNLFRFIAIWCVLLLTGCLEFEQQTLTYRYDVPSDTFRIFQVYQGIFGGDQPKRLTDKELEELKSILSGQRTFFFANWIMEYDHDQVRRELDQLNKPETMRDSKQDPATILRRKAFFELLLNNVRVENGSFYLDDHGKLCGTQGVTITRFSNLIAAGNEQIRDLLKQEAGGEKVSAEDRALYLKFAEQQVPYLAVKGNQLSLRLPLTNKEFEKSFGPNSSSAKQLGELNQWGGKFAFADNEMKWSVGAPMEQATTLTLSVSEKRYIPNALDAVKSRAVVREKLDITAAQKAFIWEMNPKAKPSKS
jgi:hypothetical protein